MNTEQVVALIACKCFFCQETEEHKHSIEIEWGPTSDLLLKAESLDPNDRVKLESCNLCGHTRIREN